MDAVLCICCEGHRFLSVDEECPLCEGRGAFVDYDTEVDYMIDFYEETVPDIEFYKLTYDEKLERLDDELNEYFLYGTSLIK